MAIGKTIKAAILDLYEGQPNQGMRCLREILNTYAEYNQLQLTFTEFDVRLKNEVPDLSFDFYISSGGPGSPLDSEGSAWEEVYFNWLQQIETWNASQPQKKYIFFICHSFQLACRHYNIGTVEKRRSTAFGVFPVHMINGAAKETVFTGLKDPFYAVDSRDYQVIKPNHQRLREMGAHILCIEKDRPHIPLERAIMAVRFNEYMIGTQFHPEADAEGMRMYLQREDKKQTVIDNHGFDKWQSMVEHLGDPDKILYTYNHILPNFLKAATA
ncbi:MAG: GMP synthase [Sphingobacteriales bacterium]|nr:MAG: GMP synthase [Sphingobacteriales bacterium]